MANRIKLIEEGKFPKIWHLFLCCLFGAFAVSSMVFPTTAVAQNGFPQPQYRNINDYAEVIKPSDEAKILAHLRDLRAKQGIQVEILTVNSISDYDVP